MVENSTALGCFFDWKCVNTSIEGRESRPPKKHPASQQLDAITPLREIMNRTAAGSQRLGLPGVGTRDGTTHGTPT